MEIPECVMQTVRLSVQCKSEEEARVRVQIGILIAGSQDGVDHIIKCVRRNYIFTPNDRILNFDDLLPYWELTQCANCHKQSEFSSEAAPGPGSPPMNLPSTSSASPPPMRPCCSFVRTGNGKSCFLVGDHHDALKITIVITPKCDYEF